MIKPDKVEFDCDGIAYIEWDQYSDDVDHYFLGLYRWLEDEGWMEVRVRIKKSELEKIRDAIDKTLGRCD